jgi:hypothetical protein
VFSTNSAAASTLQDEVRWSQFMQVWLYCVFTLTGRMVASQQWLALCGSQAEGLRFSFQAHRRAKPHRSAANSWTFNVSPSLP